MTRAEFDAIKARTARLDPMRDHKGEPSIVLICVTPGTNVPAHPDDFGPDVAARFKARCESVAQANKDRKALLAFIEECFEIEWPEPPTPER